MATNKATDKTGAADKLLGKKIPAFEGLTADGKITHRDFAGAVSVLYFYPKDNTPGCTTEACDFRDKHPQFKRLGINVYGVSKDSLAAHDKFADKYELPFTLISDTDGNICEKFGTWIEKSMYGKKYQGIDRATFLIDEKGIVRHVWRKVKVAGHVDEILNKIKELK